jgi:hypothetical protein
VNKGSKIALVALAVISLVCLIGVWSMFTNAKGVIEKVKAESVTEGNTVLALLCADWKLADVELRTAKSFAVSQSQLDAWREEYGTMQGGDLRISEFDITPDALLSTLKGRIAFEKQAGDVTLLLTRVPGNSWELADFEVVPSP